MLGGATDLLPGCLVGCVTDWQQETRGLFYFCYYFEAPIWDCRSLNRTLGKQAQVSKSDCPGLPVVKPFILSGPCGHNVDLVATFGAN